MDSGDQGFGLNTKPLERWQKILSADAANLVAEICGKTARHLGYDVAPKKHRGIYNIARQMTDLRGQVTVAGKLTYLGLRELELGKLAPSLSPFRVLKAT